VSERWACSGVIPDNCPLISMKARGDIGQQALIPDELGGTEALRGYKEIQYYDDLFLQSNCGGLKYYLY